MNKETVSIRAANGLYLVGLVLLISLGSIMQLTSFYPGLIATELVCILAPALILVLIKRLPLRSSLRLNWPGWKTAGLALLLGLGIWPFAALIDVTMSQVMGYSMPMPADALPRTATQALLAFIALAISAPLAEEVFFRGLIQRAYGARYGKWAGILIPALLFVMYHMRLQGLPALLPIAVLISWVYWRTQSLWAAMLVHFGNNAFSSLVSIQSSFNPANPLPVFSIWAALVGLAVVLVGIVLLSRTAPAVVEEARVETVEGEPGWLARYWPVLAALPIYLLMALGELVMGMFPEMLAMGQALLLRDPAWSEPLVMNYQLNHKGGEAVGEAQCQLTPAAGEYALDCDIQQETFEYTTGSSLWAGEAYQDHLEVRWLAEDMSLTALQRERTNAKGVHTVRAQTEGGEVSLTVSEDDTATGSLSFPAESLVIDEWPWRLMGQTFSAGVARETSVVWPAQYDASLGISTITQRDQVMVVIGLDTVTVPAGTMFTWKVELGDQTAWYELDAPHRLVKWDNGMITYEMTE